MKRYPACIMGTCVVPWDERGEFVEELFRHEVQTLLQTGTKHLYVFGTAGEGYAVSDRQFDRIVPVFAECMRAGGGDPIVGIINLSLTTIIDRIERSREWGARQFQISLPSWGALADREVFEFFRQTCGRFPDCRFMHYNLLRTKRLITPAEYAQLAEEHPNLVATKNSTDSMDRLEELIRLTPQLQHFFTEYGFAYGSLIGECGLLISLAAMNWKAAHRFFEAGRRQEAAPLLATQREMMSIGRELAGIVGAQAHMDGAYDKLLWKLHDERFPLRLLPPYEAADESCFERLSAALREKYPNWAPQAN